MYSYSSDANTSASAKTVHKYRAEVDRIERNILLIGPSQNGKSSLANFLTLGRSLKDKEEPPFPIGNGLKSCTDTWNSKMTNWYYKYLPPDVVNQVDIYKDKEKARSHLKIKVCKIRIIDTPGTGDTDENSEEKKMQQIYNELVKIRNSKATLSMVILVVKYPSLLNKEFERCIQFYKKMIPEVMDSNLFLILTNVENNKEWRRKQMRGGRPDPNVLINELQVEVQKMMGYNKIPGQDFVITMETIDTLCDSGTPEEKNGMRVRERIFETCMKTPNVNLNLIRLPKTKLLLEICKSEIDKFNGEKEGIIKGINLVESALSEITKKINKQSTELQEAERKFNETNAELEAKDNDQMQIIFNKSYAQKSHWLSNWWPSNEFEVSTAFPIKQIQVVGAYAGFDKDAETERHIKGRLYNTFWNDLECHLTLYTYKKIFYAEHIKILLRQQLDSTNNVNSCKERFNDSSGEALEFQNKLKAYREQIAEIDRNIQYLAMDYIKLPDLECLSSERITKPSIDTNRNSENEIDINSNPESIEIDFEENEGDWGWDIFPTNFQYF